ncbi:uncharacterized protein LOC132722803 [Ruditapes philippinarum]|uniref:uncharacterized protein LOC132722803 n=1 Tax=Ruditapes philippinarum TaxID=129788 RepID=UPI00295A79F9|nr:uncharacterized protein LOC132722803 [Ruditapes philippinarum]
MGSSPSKGPKTVKWEVADEPPEMNKFINREWKPKVIKLKRRRAIPEGSISVKILDDEFDCNITSMAFLPNGDLFVVDQANKKLKLFNKHFRYQTSAQMPSNPQSVCASPNKPEVFVTFPASSRIRQIETFRNDLKRLETIQTIGKCTAIASNRFGGLAVAINITGNQWQIHLMNSRGEIQKRVHGESLFLNPDHIAITGDMNLVICDRGNHTVYHITPDGYVIFAYKEIKGPMDCFIDKLGYIFVAGPERIHQLNERGEKVQYVISKADIGFAPATLAYRDDDEFFLVAGKSDKIRVYKLKNF